MKCETRIKIDYHSSGRSNCRILVPFMEAEMEKKISGKKHYKSKFQD